MQRTNSIRPTLTPTSSDSTSTSDSDSDSTSKSVSALNSDTTKAEVLWLSGPNQNTAEQALLQSELQKTNLNHIIYGDGITDLTTNNINQIISERLSNSAHIFFNGHGRYSKFTGKHFIQISTLNSNKNDTPALSSYDFLCMAQKNIRDENKSKRVKINRILHIATCHAATLRNEIKPGSKIWKSSYVMLYSGKKESITKSVEASLIASLQYIQNCKLKQIETNPFELFLSASNVQGDCITLMGGNLRAPLISHAPKNLHDLFEEERKNRINGNFVDITSLETHRKKLCEELDLTQEEKLNQLHAILFTRIARNDDLAIKQILVATPILINSKDHRGFTPLMLACEEENLKIINLLLSYGANTETANDDQETPLIWSVMGRNTKITATLLAHGASLSAKNNNNENSLFIASYMGQTAIAKLLLENGATNFIDQPNHKGKTALMCAAKNGNLAITKLLLEAGAKTSLKDYKGQTALTIANNQNYPLTAELITQTNKLKNRPSISKEIHKLPENF